MTTQVTSLAAREPNRWAILALLGVAQLMVTLDVTIVNIALPSAEHALRFSPGSRQWVITAYALSFGSLLLLGGKLGDLFGRKWTFVGGLAGFSFASAIGGLAPSFAVLVAARALQGIFAALLAPSALSLLTVTFQGSPDRAKAFGVFTALAGGGASIGLLLGGIITQALSWRWCLYVNLLIALPVGVSALRLIGVERHPARPRLDVRGVLLAGGGLFALVFGVSRAATSSWSSATTIVPLAASAALVIAFAVLETRVDQPLLPLHILLDRARGGAYASMAFAGSGALGLFLFLTFYLQRNLGFTPLQTGLAFLPFTGAVVIIATINQTRVLPRTGARPLVAVGSLMGVAAMALLTRLGPHSQYAGAVLPSLVLGGAGVGSVFSSALSTGTLGVKRADAGVASALINTAQQVGGSVGTAVLSTIFASAMAGYSFRHPRIHGVASAAAMHGYRVAFGSAAGIFALGVLDALFVLPSGRATRTGGEVGEPASGAIDRKAA